MTEIRVAKVNHDDRARRAWPVLVEAAASSRHLRYAELGARINVHHRAFAKPLHSQKIISVIRKEINRKKFGGELPKRTHQYQRNKDNGNSE